VSDGAGGNGGSVINTGNWTAGADGAAWGAGGGGGSVYTAGRAGGLGGKGVIIIEW
jgi:hypothetical protein